MNNLHRLKALEEEHGKLLRPRSEYKVIIDNILGPLHPEPTYLVVGHPSCPRRMTKTQYEEWRKG